MLHCPRCSGPLHVRDEEAKAKASTEPNKCCPAGNLCPAAAAAAAKPSSMISSQHHSQQHRAAYLQTGPATSTLGSSGGVLLPSPTAEEASSPSPQLLAQSLSSPLLNLNLLGLQQPQTESPQQRMQMLGAAAATLSAPWGQQFASPVNVLAPHHHHHHQQHQLLQQHQQQLQLQQQIQQLQQQQLLLAQQQQLIPASPFPVVSTSPQLLLTSTIGHQLSPSSVALTTSAMCGAPSTPAIVVGSSGLPFFAPTTQQQPIVHHQQQQQPLSLSVPVPFTQQQQQPKQHPKLAPTLSAAAIAEVLESNRAELTQCGWYYPGLRWDESAAVLQDAAPGAFLIRDSADSRFLYSLSVQRSPEEGPTSVRIHFQGGLFKLDAEDAIRDLMPSFRSVVSLIEHYLGLTGAPSLDDTPSSQTKKQVWVDSVGKISSPIMLKRPKYKEVPSLAHFARLSTHRRLQEVGKEEAAASEKGAFKEELPAKVREYVASYPHRV